MEVLLKKDGGLKRAYQKYHEFTRDDELREIAEAREKNERDRRGQMSYAREEGLREGMEMGMEKGVKKGRAEGITEGIEKGLRKGIVQSVARVIQRRFPLEYAPEVESRILGITDSALLDDLLMAAYESPTLDAFMKKF